MHFSEDFIEKIREANDIVEIIGRHTVFKQGGRSLMGLCPFPDHAEKSPSFSLSPDKQLYHCFGCGKSGNIYSFLRDYYGYSFIESVEYLAKRAGIPMPENKEGGVANQKSKSEKQEQKKILSLSLEFFRTNLVQIASDHKAKKYLDSRGFGAPETIETLNLGWAKEEWSALTDFLRSKEVALALAESLGLIKSKKDGSGFYDMFRGRVIFPVFSFSGEILGFGGRVLGDDKPKYLNSPESPFFKKSKILYGQNWASSHIRQHDEALLVEGYTDWAALYLAGFQNVLGTMGTALTQDHAKRLKRWCSKVVCIFDGDEAGLRASERALLNLFAEGVLARGIFLPRGEDPDSFLKSEGVDQVKDIIQNAGDLFILLLDQKLQNYSGQVYEKMEVLSWAADSLSHLDVKSPLFAVYIPEIESRLDLPAKTIKSEIQKRYQSEKRGEASPPSQVKAESVAEPEKVTIHYKKSDPELLVFALSLESLRMREELIRRDFVFSDSGAQILWKRLRERCGQRDHDSGSVEARLASFLSNPGILTLTLERPYCNLNEDQKFEIFESCLKSIEKKKLSAQAKLISKKIGQNAADEDLERFMELQRKKRNLQDQKS